MTRVKYAQNKNGNIRIEISRLSWYQLQAIVQALNVVADASAIVQEVRKELEVALDNTEEGL